MKTFRHFFTAVLLLSYIQNSAQHSTVLWSCTPWGGDNDDGTLYSYNTGNGTFTLHHNFPSINPGKYPEKNLIDGGNGKLYGVANYGSHGYGIIFEWDPITNTYTRKFDFSGSDGAAPKGLTLYNGKIYGVTNIGGANNEGVIFEWDPVTNIYLKKFDFNGSIHGREPLGALVLYNNKFYGLNSDGGLNNAGTIFEWDPATNVFTKKIDFLSTNGSTPTESMTFYNGKFYGMTTNGGANSMGVIFEWDPVANIYTKKINLTSANGSKPEGNLTLYAGKLYGLTALGGANGNGVIFEWDPASNTYTRKISFSSVLGQGPKGSLFLSLGKFYGTTVTGVSGGKGTIFQWDPLTNNFIRKINLNSNETEGAYPAGTLVLIGSKFYGTCSNGGIGTLYHGTGVLFEWDSLSNIYTNKINVGASEGSEPYGGLILKNGKLYGTTQCNGASKGVIFEWDITNSVYTKKIDLNPTIGNYPWGTLSEYGNKFYGLTSEGGSANKGTIFEWDYATNVYTKKFDFTGTNGSNPYDDMVLYNNKFYGMTTNGGVNGKGVIFEWNPSTNTYTKKIDLSTSIGSNPEGHLCLKGNKFYGMTQSGGGNNLGVIFEWDPVTNIYTKKIDLQNSTGHTPFASLVLKGGKFYGTTFLGGANNGGVIFEWDPVTNIYTKKIDLITANGEGAHQTLVLAASGKFYGTTRQGAAYDWGCLFEWDPVTNQYTKLLDFDYTRGKSPENDFAVEVSNTPPTISNIPVTQNYCFNANYTDTFNLVDAENDTSTFTVTSSNQGLIPNNNVSVSSIGGNSYQISYTPLAGQTGTTIITIIANDGYGGITTFNYTININSQATASTSHTNVSCYGDNNGTATVTMSGGAGPFTYSWSPSGGNAATATGLIAGTYTCSITDGPCVLTQTITITQPPAISFSQSPTLCNGGSITVGNNTYSVSGTYTDILTAVNGCDSVVTTNLSIVNNYTFSQSPVICANTVFSVGNNTYSVSGNYLDTLQALSGCDSIITTHLTVRSPNISNQNPTICQGQTYTVGNNTYSLSGTYLDTLIAASGCDSVITTQLTVSPTLSINQTPNICAGQNILVGNNSYGTAGTYIDTLTSVYGCDSVITTNLSVTTVNTNTTLAGNTITASATGAVYQWIDCNNNIILAGATNQSYTVLANGSYAVIITENGCIDTSACTSFNTIAVNDFELKKEISVFPNPSKGEFCLKGSLRGDYELVNCLGQIVRSFSLNMENNLIVSMRDVENGVYYIVEKNEHILLKQKVVVIR